MRMIGRLVREFAESLSLPSLLIRLAAVVDDIFLGLEDPVGQPVVAHRNFHIFSTGLSSRNFWRQGEYCDVAGDAQIAGQVPSGLVKQENSVRTMRDDLLDFLPSRDRRKPWHQPSDPPRGWPKKAAMWRSAHALHHALRRPNPNCPCLALRS